MLQMTEPKFGDSKRWDSNPRFFYIPYYQQFSCLGPTGKRNEYDRKVLHLSLIKPPNKLRAVNVSNDSRQLDGSSTKA